MKPVFPRIQISLTPARPASPAPAVPSPCINICRMDEASGYCEGCWRSLDEIALWSQIDDADKRIVLEQIALRRAAAPDPFGP
jgi:predicted Fe-S protein YdhL (DUF1289 family)